MANKICRRCEIGLLLYSDDLMRGSADGVHCNSCARDLVIEKESKKRKEVLRRQNIVVTTITPTATPETSADRAVSNFEPLDPDVQVIDIRFFKAEIKAFRDYLKSAK